MPTLPHAHRVVLAAVFLLGLAIGGAPLLAQDDDDAHTTIVEQRPLKLVMLRHGGGNDQRVYDDAEGLLRFWRANSNMRIADEPTAFSVDSLRGALKADDAPSWLLLAGDKAFAPDAELVTVLRAYVEAGGAILADARSVAWERSFHALMEAIAPDQPLRPIPADAAPLLRPAALTLADLAQTGQRALDAIGQAGAPTAAAPASDRTAETGTPAARERTDAAPESGLYGVRRGNRWTVVLHTGGLSLAWPGVGGQVDAARRAAANQIRTRSGLLALNLAFYWDRRSTVEYESNSVILKPGPATGGEPAPEADFSALPTPY